MSKTLTEQWRDGTLPEGLYYIEGKGNHDIALIRNRYCPVLTSPYCEDDVFESEFVPVAHVPSYEQFIGVMDDSKELDKAYDKINLLEKKLEIATKALQYYAQCKHINLDLVTIRDGCEEFEVFEDGEYARKALKEMEEVK